MPFYHKLGKIPHKRHTQFRKPDGSATNFAPDCEDINIVLIRSSNVES